MGKTLAIRGDKERGNEVIALLEMLGGDNIHNLYGDQNYAYYVIEGVDNEIRGGIYIYGDENLRIFTLDEFYEKYPFKFGDKVTLNKYDCKFMVTKVEWTGYAIRYLLFHHAIGNEWWTIEEIKEDNMETKVEGSLIVSEDISKNERMEIDLNEYEYKVENDKLIILKKKPVYPKTYRGCFYTLYGHTNDAFNLSGVTDEEYGLISNFIILKRCRDAYWKIAGEEMGLDGPWVYDMSKDEFSYAISYQYGYIQKNEIRHKNSILIFPTAEIRDAFYENFKELIENCKEFL